MCPGLFSLPALRHCLSQAVAGACLAPLKPHLLVTPCTIVSGGHNTDFHATFSNSRLAGPVLVLTSSKVFHFPSFPKILHFPFKLLQGK